VFIERLWRSLKYEKIYLNEYENVPEVRAGIKQYLTYYNTIRPHQSLNYRTPWEVYSDRSKQTLQKIDLKTKATNETLTSP
jgi:putative transposase